MCVSLSLCLPLCVDVAGSLSQTEPEEVVSACVYMCVYACVSVCYVCVCVCISGLWSTVVASYFTTVDVAGVYDAALGTVSAAAPAIPAPLLTRLTRPTGAVNTSVPQTTILDGSDLL